MTRGFEDIRLTLPGIELAGHLYGPANGRPVIALHGWLDNAASFERLLPKLEGVRVLALDLPGHALSGRRPEGAGYPLWDYLPDVVRAADAMGWQRFALLGHSLGASVSMLVAAALPERVERLALIDGILPLTTEAEQAPDQLRQALQEQLGAGRGNTVYPSYEAALVARMSSRYPVSREAAELLARRGVVAVPGGFSWHNDPRLKRSSPLRMDRAQADAFLARVSCPVRLVLAEGGIFASPTAQGWLRRYPFEQRLMPGGHHLHLDDEAGAEAVGRGFEGFL